MSWIPGGAEEDDEDDDLYLDDMDYHSNVNLIDFDDNKLTPIKQKPKRNSLIASNGSTSGTLLLNDVRMNVINGNIDSLRELMANDNSFFVDTVLMAGWTPLMYASNCGHKDIVEFLIERGADPNYHIDNFTPLMAVCTGSADEERLISCAQHLIESGADVNAVDKHGYNGLIYASKLGKCGLIEELIANGVDISHANNDLWNALHWAVGEGKGRAVEILLRHNIDISLKTYSAQTAEDIAESRGYQKIKDILETIRQRDNENTNGLKSESNVRQLTDEEINTLKTFVKPVVDIQCRQQRDKTKPKIPDNEELELFLRITNREQLFPEFERQGLSYTDLVTNPEEVLRKVGINEISELRKLLAQIYLLHKQDYKKESLKELDLDTNLTSPEILCILSNIANHLTRIEQTIVFLKNKVIKKPEIMNENTSVVRMDQVFNETLQGLINTRSLYQELQSFRNVIESIEDISEPQTPDVLSIPFTLEDELNIECEKTWKYYKSFVFSVVIVGTLGLFAIKYKNINKNIFTLTIPSIMRYNFL